MTDFTADAEFRLDAYLAAVRLALAHAPDVDPAEVEADVREHIAAEFAGRTRPVGLAELEPVLARLGPPEAWAGGSPPGLRDKLVGGVRTARGWVAGTWRRVVGAVRHGPEDWRLTYLTFGLFALGVVVFPLFPAFLLVSYLLGRCAVALAGDAGLGARRWLVYPPLVCVSLPLLLAVLSAPVWVGIGAGAFVDEGVRVMRQPVRERPHVRTALDRELMARSEKDAAFAARFLDPIPGPTDAKPVVAGVAVGAGAMALWYGLLGLLTWAYPGVPRAVFAPLFGRVEPRHGRAVAVGGLVVLAGWGWLAYRYLVAVEVV